MHADVLHSFPSLRSCLGLRSYSEVGSVGGTFDLRPSDRTASFLYLVSCSLVSLSSSSLITDH
jgi:hypothetical protein